MTTNIVEDVNQFIQVEQYHKRIDNYIEEGKDLLKQILPPEEFDLVDDLIIFTMMSSYWKCSDYGSAVTPSWIKNTSKYLKTKINRVKKKHGISI